LVKGGVKTPPAKWLCLVTANRRRAGENIASVAMGGHMAGFLGAKEVLTRERVKEILRNKEYSYLEEKVSLLEVRDDSLLLKISFLIEYHKRMISIEEKEPITIALKDFKVEDWGDGIRKVADIE
jgi:hypothetical protein